MKITRFRFILLIIITFLSSLFPKTVFANNLGEEGIFWCWIGAVKNNQVTIKAKIRKDIINQNQYIQIKYSTDSRFFTSQDSLDSLRGVQATSLVEQIATFKIDNLEEDQKYYYVIIAGGRRYPKNHGDYLTFKTVKVHQQYDFAIGCSSCASGGVVGAITNGVSNNKIFDIIREQNNPPLTLFIHMGDLHYRNDFLGSEKDLDDYRKNYDVVMSQDKQRELYQNIPLAYIWDDHDYGPNNSYGSYKLKYVASEAYRENVPHYPLEEKTVNKAQNSGAIYQSFVIGRVRFVMTDNRFYKDELTDENGNMGKTILGEQQKKWFFEQLSLGKNNQIANTECLTIWINSVPWIAGEDGFQTNDAWDRYPSEREEIANFIKDNKIDNLLMISGDAHMLAFDDGENDSANNYATAGGGSFPVIHAASLDSAPSIKGGPYNGQKYFINQNSEKIENGGAVKGNQQWGLLNFIDDGNKLQVDVELKRKTQTIVQHSFVFKSSSSV